MLTVVQGSQCDICLEDYEANLLPYSLPCGHLLCATCCTGITRNSQANCACPFCRSSFTLRDARPVRVEFAAGGAGSVRGSKSTPRQPVSAAPTRGGGRGISDQLEIHHAVCDVCRAEIQGKRYKCVQCPDWDACERCYLSRVAEVHRNHSFVRIHKQGDYLPAHGGLLPAHAHLANCDSCSGTIVGDRYHCTHPSCPDFDLCANCEALPIRVHPADHLMLKIVKPVATPRSLAASVVEHPANCNICSRKIYDVRYKCLTCYDFDLCEACETSPIPQHPRTHTMLKIKIPQHMLASVNSLTAALRQMNV